MESRWASVVTRNPVWTVLVSLAEVLVLSLMDVNAFPNDMTVVSSPSIITVSYQIERHGPAIKLLSAGIRWQTGISEVCCVIRHLLAPLSPLKIPEIWKVHLIPPARHATKHNPETSLRPVPSQRVVLGTCTSPRVGRGVKNTVGLVLKKIRLFYGFWSQCNVRKQAVVEKWEISDVVRSIFSSTVTLETFACSEEKRARSQSLDSCRFPSYLHKLCMKLPSFYTAEKNPNHPRCHCSERRKKGGVPLNGRWLNPVMLNRAATTGENNLVLLLVSQTWKTNTGFQSAAGQGGNLCSGWKVLSWVLLQRFVLFVFLPLLGGETSRFLLHWWSWQP